MRRKARRVTQADFHAQGRAFVSDVVRDIAALERSQASQVVATTLDGRACTRKQLTDAFNRVAPSDNWKQPIDITLQLEPLDREVVREAVIFFTGSIPKFEYTGCCGDLTCRVTAVGYYAACGA